MSLELILFNKPQAKAAIQAQLYPFLAQALEQSGQWVLSVKRKKRTNLQNRRYWGNGVLKQIAEQAAVNGRMYSPEIWHELFKKQFIGVEELPDGSLIGKSSTELTTAEFCEFCDKVEAYAASDLGVVFYDLPSR